jgi:hypothetical protein
VTTLELIGTLGRLRDEKLEQIQLLKKLKRSHSEDTRSLARAGEIIREQEVDALNTVIKMVTEKKIDREGESESKCGICEENPTQIAGWCKWCDAIDHGDVNELIQQTRERLRKYHQSGGSPPSTVKGETPAHEKEIRTKEEFIEEVLQWILETHEDDDEGAQYLVRQGQKFR